MVSNVSDQEAQYRQIFVNKKNLRKKTCLLCCSRRVQMYINNKVTTSKYNFITFLPLNLLLQFSKMANLYFLVLTIAELYPPISDSAG